MKKSICIITQTSGFGGVEIYTLSLIRLLINEYSIEFVSCLKSVYDKKIKQFGLGNIKIIPVTVGVNDSSSEALKKWKIIMNEIKSDILVFTKGGNEMGCLGFLRICRRKFKKIYYIEHSVTEPLHKSSTYYLGGLIKGLGLWRYKRKLYRKMRYVYADQIIAVSHAVERALVDNCGYKKNKIITIPSGVFVEHYQRDPHLGSLFKKQHGLSEMDYIFGMVTRLHWMKGIDIAIKAFKSLTLTTTKKASLIIVGEGEEENSLKKIAADLDMQDKVKFIGFLDDPKSAYCAIDCIILTSRSEALGLSLLEGMATGCIPIVTNVGGMPEVVISSDFGFVIPPEDTESLCNAMKQLLQMDDDKKKKIINNITEKIRMDYNADINFKMIYRLLEKDTHALQNSDLASAIAK